MGKNKIEWIDLGVSKDTYMQHQMDVEIIKRNLYKALKVPKELLGEKENNNMVTTDIKWGNSL